VRPRRPAIAALRPSCAADRLRCPPPFQDSRAHSRCQAIVDTIHEPLLVLNTRFPALRLLLETIIPEHGDARLRGHLRLPGPWRSDHAAERPQGAVRNQPEIAILLAFTDVTDIAVSGS
jgi:hypothetical protein